MTQYATSPDIYWLYPHEHPPPQATKLALLTKGHVQVVGNWRDGDFIAWQYLFRRDKEKEKLA